MDIVLAFVTSKLNGDKREALTLIILGTAFFTFPFFICALVVGGTANSGFNIVLTAILNCGFVVGAFYVVKNSKTPIAIGFLIGVSAMTTLLNFMTAIYWGQLANCKSYVTTFPQYSCSQPAAYSAVSCFAVFIFLCQLAFTGALVFWRGELISETGSYDPVSTTIPPYEISKGAPFAQAPPSADL